jgi:ribosome-binding protein aMBF1 (putative translation factor)
MMPRRWQFSRPKQRNGQHRDAPVEALSARIFRHRIARGYSVYDLATAARVFAGTIKCLESGKPADKRVLPALARALGVPLCRLVCGEHNCIERACVRPRPHAHRSSGFASLRSGFLD